MQGDLKALLRLQETDVEVSQAEAELRELNPEIVALNAELEAAEAKLEAARRSAAEAEKRRAELEGRIESYRVMQERRRQRLEWVKGAKEASTIMAELDLARSVLAKEEAEWLRSAGVVEAATKAVTEAEQVIDEIRAAQAPRREEISTTVAAHEKRLEEVRATRATAAAGVRDELLTVYERVLRGRAPRALYALRGGACGHCFTAVPLHRRHEIQNGESFAPCEACGVLIYLQEDPA